MKTYFKQELTSIYHSTPFLHLFFLFQVLKVYSTKFMTLIIHLSHPFIIHLIFSHNCITQPEFSLAKEVGIYILRGWENNENVHSDSSFSYFFARLS